MPKIIDVLGRFMLPVSGTISIVGYYTRFVILKQQFESVIVLKKRWYQNENDGTPFSMALWSNWKGVEFRIRMIGVRLPAELQ